MTMFNVKDTGLTRMNDNDESHQLISKAELHRRKAMP